MDSEGETETWRLLRQISLVSRAHRVENSYRHTRHDPDLNKTARYSL